MNKTEALAERISNGLEKLDKIRNENALRYCSENGLDPNDASQYAQAVTATALYMRPPTAEEMDYLRAYTKNLSKASNNCCQCGKIEMGKLDDISDEYNERAYKSLYGWWKDIEAITKKAIDKAKDEGVTFVVSFFVENMAQRWKLIDTQYLNCIEKTGKENVCGNSDRNGLADMVDDFIRILPPSETEIKVKLQGLRKQFLYGGYNSDIRKTYYNTMKSVFPQYAVYFSFLLDDYEERNDSIRSRACPRTHFTNLTRRVEYKA